MSVRNLTVFSEVGLKFGRNLNVLVGENGTGKTHLLKMAYSALAVYREDGRNPNAPPPTETWLQSRVAGKLINVFRPETLGRLTRRQAGRARCEINVRCYPLPGSISFSFAANSLFLLRELELLLERRKGDDYEARFFGLHFSDQGVTVEQGASVNDIGDIRSLDEELNQSNRFLTTERPAA